ncbi:DUF488 family protein [Leptolyngbya sp. FACHB-36]|uniref:DUF488 family protein, N3 subclade n=1 Tax=Leptolyngbya sp. FACHB-36 TaxID=2692808 RepID=UPI001680C6E7|nr:DUF488 family protein [Leptolyngbya sp. FACHB-36]MBD2019399.1 DUF488 family protein [Leptolyngbya sp. FACHB-36]
MAIYTASYFAPDTHHGKLIAISRSLPADGPIAERLDLFAPTVDLLKFWKHSAQDDAAWVEYEAWFWSLMGDRKPEILEWLHRVSADEDMTLLCWEKTDDRCHRRLVGRLIQKRRSELWGGESVAIVSPPPAKRSIEGTEAIPAGSKFVPSLSPLQGIFDGGLHPDQAACVLKSPHESLAFPSNNSQHLEDALALLQGQEGSIVMHARLRGWAGVVYEIPWGLPDMRDVLWTKSPDPAIELPTVPRRYPVKDLIVVSRRNP